MSITFVKTANSKHTKVTKDGDHFYLVPSDYDIMVNSNGISLHKNGDFEKKDRMFSPFGIFQHDEVDWAGSDPSQTAVSTNEEAADIIAEFFFDYLPVEGDFSFDIQSDQSAPAKGTAAIDTASYRIRGRSLELNYNYKQTTAGVAGLGGYVFPLPDLIVLDLSRVGDSGTGLPLPVIGTGLVKNAVASYPAALFALSDRTLGIALISTGEQIGGLVLGLGLGVVEYIFTDVVVALS